MKLRQLDDSDDCVFVYDDPSGNETFSVGIYVDNMQIVHSAELDERRRRDRLQLLLREVHEADFAADWDIVDEGP